MKKNRNKVKENNSRISVEEFDNELLAKQEKNIKGLKNKMKNNNLTPREKEILRRLIEVELDDAMEDVEENPDYIAELQVLISKLN